MSRRIRIWQAVRRSTLCIGITGLLCISLFGHARATEPPLDETIIVWVEDGFTQVTKTPLRVEMLNLVKESTLVNKENIEKIAVAYLAPRLKSNAPATTNPSVISHASLNHKRFPVDDLTILRINYTPWIQHVDGQRVIIGALAVHPSQYNRQSSGICIPIDKSEFDPVDTFIITDDDAQTQRNIESAIARLLERYTRGIRQKF